ncbi:PpiC-type peptidyl-prolyl cis-trans isomerase [Nostoc commune NIES-4072]|uniref:peptidylprolyl isomerase n=1 Tax=Nostoc commune NIES-4072 TaxID=2005467 RepID=A0A2R5FY55_NOSCO|nr:peptidylprolyl isomerase [Nostoc commune]BBD66621.1 PpiC-type peptidyl-prolyl cis-trans isomerase [Nostoc commune HK-02]GBG22398.1 PpiC-type peptidyl-prolyl cis-trans isomerase [Nostoc commune NIES-4072]
MSQTITITNEDILEQVKLSSKIPEIIEEIITRKIIAAAVAEASIKVETEELQKIADQLRVVNKLNTANDTWAWLGKHGLSLEEFEEIVYNTVISRKLAAHLFADKVEPYFFENQLDYTSVVMFEVILDDEDLALELFYAIREDEMSFYDVAHKYIQDTELRRKGGYRGIVRRQDMTPEISAAVFAAKPPQLLKPIITSKGAHLILVEEIIQAELDKKLRSKIILDFFSAWLKQKNNQVEVIRN